MRGLEHGGVPDVLFDDRLRGATPPKTKNIAYGDDAVPPITHNPKSTKSKKSTKIQKNIPFGDVFVTPQIPHPTISGGYWGVTLSPQNPPPHNFGGLLPHYE